MDEDLRTIKRAVQTQDADALRVALDITPYKADLLCQAVYLASGKTAIAKNRVISDDPSKKGIFARKWQSMPTRTVRVPVALADDILHIAHEIDAGLDYRKEIQTIINNYRQKKVGYYSAHIKDLIADLQALI